MQKMQTKPFNRWLSLLLALVMFFGLFPGGGVVPAQAAITNPDHGGFELPVAGATGYAIQAITMGGTSIPAGAPFRILAEEGSNLKIKYGDKTGTIPATRAMVNLPDVIPSIVYNATNATGSLFKSNGFNLDGITGQSLYAGKTENKRLGRSEFNMPVLYAMAKKLARVQANALKDGRTLIMFEGYRPTETQRAVKDSMQNLMDSNSTVKNDISSFGDITWFISTKEVGNHQKGYAVDVSMATVEGTENITVGDVTVQKPSGYSSLNMPTQMHELSTAASIYVSSASNTKRPSFTNSEAGILQNYCTNAGLSPLKSEWWHFNDEAAHSAAGDSMLGDFKITSNVSTTPAEAESGSTTTTPDPSDPGGGGGGGGGTSTGGSSTFNDMQSLIDNNGGELTLDLSLQHIAASDAHKIYSEKSGSRPIGGNLGTWSGYGMSGNGFCADHTLDARMNGMKVTGKEAYKETDPILVNTYYYGFTGEERTADAMYNKVIKDKVSSLPGFTMTLEDLNDDEWRMATQYAIWMALKTPTGNPHLSLEGQVSYSGGSISPGFNESAHDKIRTNSPSTNSGAGQQKVLKAAIALNLWAQYASQTPEFNICGRTVGANSDAIEGRANPSPYGERYNEDAAALDFTQDGSLKKYDDAYPNSGVYKQTINGKEYYVIYWMFTSKSQSRENYMEVALEGNYPPGTVLANIDPTLDGAVFADVSDTNIYQGTGTPGTNIVVWNKAIVNPPAGYTTPEDQSSAENPNVWPAYFKVCVPVDAADAENADIQIKMKNLTVFKYDLYRAANTDTNLQAFLIGDNNAGVETTGRIKWGHTSPDFGEITIYKKDDKGAFLQGAQFELVCSDPNKTLTATTDASGQASVPVPEDCLKDSSGNPTVWKIKETKAPGGYELKDEEQTVTVNESAPVSVTFVNDGGDDGGGGDAVIYKVDAASGKGLPNARFHIYSTGTGWDEYLLSDGNGMIVLQWKDPAKPNYIKPGTYTVEEVDPPSGYNLDDHPESRSITFNEDGSHTGPLYFKNSKKPGIKVVKIDGLTGLPLNGAYFNVYKDGEPQGQTGHDGAGLSNGYYEFEELTAPEGYIRDRGRKGVHVNLSSFDPDWPVVEVVFENYPISIKLKKVSADDNSPLKGAIFNFYIDSTLEDTLETDDNGEIVIDIEKYGRFLNEEENEILNAKVKKSGLNKSEFFISL